MNMLQAKGITKDYGDFKLGPIDLELSEGQLFACLGPNGSGKSTLVKILTGQIRPTTGKASILKVDAIKDPVKARSLIGIIPEQESPPSFLTVSEYLEFICKVRKTSPDKIAWWLDFFAFAHEKDTLIKDLSRGTKQKLVATQAFIHRPKLVFIDEPLINLDPLIQKKFKDYLKSYVKKGNSVFLSTHVLEIADEICTHVGILKDGKLILRSDIASIKKKSKDLETFFIGAITDET